MKLGRLRRRTGHGTRSWPVLLLLLAVVLLPTAGVLWFMGQAMRNEQLAVRQKLSDVYRAQLLDLQHELQLHWQSRSTELEVRDPTQPAARVFAARVRQGLADSVVVYDPGGRPAYPSSPPLVAADQGRPSASWRRAQRLEHSGRSEEAAARYATIAAQAQDRHLAARARQAQARCLAQTDRETAISILTDELGRPEYETAADPEGRLIAPSALLRALQLLGASGGPSFESVAAELRRRLNDYDSALPAAQRRFLMKELRALAPTGPTPDTLLAEELAARYLESNPPAPPTTSIQPGGLPEIWHLASPSGAVVALFDERRLLEDLESLIARQRQLPEKATVKLLAPDAEPEDVFVVSLPVGGYLQDWQLVLRPDDQALFATAASQRITAYRLTAALVVLALLLLTLLVAGAVNRQLRLTRLKNDILATVSHELKTPLASIRLLVDTLLETGIEDSKRVREYLQLIAKENVRLSRLVDNFLTFSRMEQNRQSFAKEPVTAATVVEDAAASVADRFRSSGCHFEVHAKAGLPTLHGDHDALVAVLLNLLDNAYKYSNEEKHIVLKSYGDNGHVCFAVQDNGIGLPRRVAGKIFDRFYQADQSLSRPGSGCGLGLSIVEYIVRAHRGTVDVASRPGKGSTFTVRLPVAADEEGSPEGGS